MNNDPMITEEIKEPELPRWVQVPIGVALGLITLFCLVGSVTIFTAENHKTPWLAPIIGIIWVLACIWVFEKCFRLISGRKIQHGLMAPCTLKLFSWFFLLLPIVGLFTGYSFNHPVRAAIQSIAYVFAFFGIRRMAKYRESQNA